METGTEVGIWRYMSRDGEVEKREDRDMGETQRERERERERERCGGGRPLLSFIANGKAYFRN